MIYHWPAQPPLYIEICWCDYWKNHEKQIIYAGLWEKVPEFVLLLTHEQQKAEST